MMQVAIKATVTTGVRVVGLSSFSGIMPRLAFRSRPARHRGVAHSLMWACRAGRARR